MSRIYKTVDQLIGHTPLLELSHIKKNHNLQATIIAKLEYFNPTGSVKDRIAKSILDDAEARGILKPNSVIIEPTSGNTGIGLSAVAAARGSVSYTHLDVYKRQGYGVGQRRGASCCPACFAGF